MSSPTLYAEQWRALPLYHLSIDTEEERTNGLRMSEAKKHAVPQVSSADMSEQHAACDIGPWNGILSGTR